MERLQVRDLQVGRYPFGEPLEVLGVPLVGPGGLVALDPAEERVEDLDSEHPRPGCRCGEDRFRWAGHQFVIEPPGFRLVGRESDLLLTQLDIVAAVCSRQNGSGRFFAM